MGSIIKAYCDCGYENIMPLGGGMENFTTYCNFPVYCEECSDLPPLFVPPLKLELEFKLIQTVVT